MSRSIQARDGGATESVNREETRRPDPTCLPLIKEPTYGREGTSRAGNP